GIGIEYHPDVSEGLHAGGARVQVLPDGTNAKTATAAQGYATRIIQQFGADVATDIVPAGIDERASAWYNPGLESRVYNIPAVVRSEEHTSELQSRENLVCRLLLEKKKKKTR